MLTVRRVPRSRSLQLVHNLGKSSRWSDIGRSDSGSRRHGSGPRQQRLQPAPQGPPLFRQLLVSLLRPRLLRRLIDRRIRCRHQAISLVCLYSLRFVILSEAKELLFVRDCRSIPRAPSAGSRVSWSLVISMYINIYAYTSKPLPLAPWPFPPAGPGSPSPAVCSSPLPATARHTPAPAARGSEPPPTVCSAGSSSRTSSRQNIFSTPPPPAAPGSSAHRTS